MFSVCKVCFYPLSNPFPSLSFFLSLSLHPLLNPQTVVFSHFLVTCQLEKYFPDASSFRPERWLENRSSNSSTSINPFSLLPFGFGNRMCVGRRFSELQLYLSVAKVIMNFHLKPVTQTLNRTHAFIVVPSHDVSVKFILRKSSV